MLLGWEQRGAGLVPPASLGSSLRGMGQVGQKGGSFPAGQRGVHAPCCWGFVFFLQLLAREAGRVGCKPCPWNLPSQLGPKMSKTPDRERRGRGGEDQERETLHALPLGSRDEKREEGRGGFKNPPGPLSLQMRRGRGRGPPSSSPAAQAFCLSDNYY